DSNGQVSNVGYLLVTVNPAQTGWATLDSFESGTDGWGPLPGAAGTVALSSNSSTDGKYSLQVNVTAPGWFGIDFPAPVNLSSWSSLALDITPTSVGGYSAFAFQAGSSYEWCQSASWQPLALFSTTTLTLQLESSALTCYLNGAVVETAPDLTGVHSFFVSLPSVGTYYLDNLRAGPATGTATELPVIAGVSNAGSGQVGVSAGTYISIYGSDLASAGSAVDWSDSIVDGQLPTKLAGVSVSVGGTPAYLSYVSPGQINALVPNLNTGQTAITVTTSLGTSEPYIMTAAAVLPAFFEWGSSYVVATDVNYNVLAINGTVSGTTTAPAQPGEIIILWGTGFGPTTPAALAGQVTPANLYSVNGVTVTVGGTQANVLGTALSPGSAGLYQVAITVPSTLANGTYPIVATVGGVQSPSGVNLAVQQ
ncbi:MAG TPA: IPT/TIG domain-containing protein, partial [Bryobacteraceae bacterium]